VNPFVVKRVVGFAQVFLEHLESRGIGFTVEGVIPVVIANGEVGRYAALIHD